MSEGPDVVKMIREIIAANPMGRTSVTAELLIMFLEEIERLREQLAEAEEQVGDLIDDAAGADPKDRVWMLVPLAEWDEKENRIEELATAIGQVLNMRQEIIDKVIAGENCHIITTEQIRAAWDQTHNTASNGVYARGAENALKELGIVECEGCGGDGDFGPTDGGVWRCPDCAEWGSEGFKIGGEDE